MIVVDLSGVVSTEVAGKHYIKASMRDIYGHRLKDRSLRKMHSLLLDKIGLTTYRGEPLAQSKCGEVRIFHPLPPRMQPPYNSSPDYIS